MAKAFFHWQAIVVKKGCHDKCNAEDPGKPNGEVRWSPKIRTLGETDIDMDTLHAMKLLLLAARKQPTPRKRQYMAKALMSSTSKPVGLSSPISLTMSYAKKYIGTKHHHKAAPK